MRLTGGNFGYFRRKLNLEETLKNNTHFTFYGKLPPQTEVNRSESDKRELGLESAFQSFVRVVAVLGNSEFVEVTLSVLETELCSEMVREIP